MKIWLLLYLFFVSFSSHAVVKRHDISPEKYVLQQAPDFLIDMPHEGHGVLINPQWVVTVAHTIFYDYVGLNLTVGSNAYQIENVYIHTEYTELSEELLKGDMAPLMGFLKARSDIALLKLSAPVNDVEPIKIYKGTKEKGKTITVFGKGATGDGLKGENPDTKLLRQLNHFKNVVENSEVNWLTFIFDRPADGLPLEGMHGSGDSGGPAIMFQGGEPLLVGLSSWQLAYGDITTFKGGLYGTTAYQVRISSYAEWIMRTINSSKKP